MTDRQASDYGEMLVPDRALTENRLAEARVFVEEMKAQLAKIRFDLEEVL
ncbi:MAG: hypothetical protein RLZZ597_2580 [Cyanobacteriota bacterium]|jgi:hypothetical protein